MKCLVNAKKDDNKSDVQLAIFEKDLTLQKSMTGTSLARIEKKVSTGDLVRTIVFLIERAVDFFNVKSTLNSSQILLMAVDFLEVYKHETIEDIVMMFKMVRQGKIGDKIFYLDSHVIMNEWMPQYLNFKAQQREQDYKTNKSNDTKLEDFQVDALNKYQKLKAKQETEKKDEFEFANADTYNNWIKYLPKTCKELTLFDLKMQITRAKNTTDEKPLKIYQDELKRRTESK